MIGGVVEGPLAWEKGGTSKEEKREMWYVAFFRKRLRHCGWQDVPSHGSRRTR